MFSDSNLQKPLCYCREALKGRITKWLCGGLQIRLRGFKSLSALFFILLFLLIILSSGRTSADLLINEIMYDPIQDDNYNEWVELYNPTNQSINISGWAITDNSAQDFLEGDFDNGNGTTIIPPNGYAIIADHGTRIYENFSIPNNTIRLYVDDSSIGNGLGNSGDKLILKNDTGETIDTVEWIINYTDVPGAPAEAVDEGHSLSRYQDVDTNDSSNDFYAGVIPTPGSENVFFEKPKLDIDLYPTYLPKIHNNSDNSLPFAIRINLSNYAANETYELKSYVVGNNSSNLPATQTWNGSSWSYSNYYTSAIITDEYGNWSGWQYIRFKGDYKEYIGDIKENNSAYLKIKIKKDNYTEEISKNVSLLDMDDSTSNGTVGGCFVGLIQDNNSFLEGKTAVIENESGVVTGIYATEDNSIDEGLISRPGYLKLTSPVASNYTIKFLLDNGSIIYTIQNVTVLQGKYDVDIISNVTSYLVRRNEVSIIPLIVKNSGDFDDTIDVDIVHVTDGWQAILEREEINLNSKKIRDVNLQIIPCRTVGCNSCTVTVLVTSENDVGESDEITFNICILASDLTIKDINIYNETDEKIDSFGEGEVVKIKASLKNLGNDNASNVIVNFYYDSINKEHFIGSKSYDSVGKYQKYPSVEWDTKGLKNGVHEILVLVDEENEIGELDESNNELAVKVYTYETLLSKTDNCILITELYYDTHPGVNNEFIAIYNPSSENIDISGWYLTNNPEKTKSAQTKIVFPYNTSILSGTYLYLTQNATAYKFELGKKPDFEYNVNSDDEIPRMIASKNFTLSNKGDTVALKDFYNHTIDVVIYGKTNSTSTSWIGAPIPSSGKGVVLKRNFKENKPLDTNSSIDWMHPRIYGIGQSEFPYVRINCSNEITTFVSPDCSFETIVNELRKANESIYLNIYEFTNPFLCNELVAALLRGVSVNIFLEEGPVGGIQDEEKFVLNRIANYGGNIRFIVNDKERDVYARYTINHAKYLIIDNKTVIVESCNWANTGVPKDPTYGNREWGIVVRSEEFADYFLKVFLDDSNPERCDSYPFNDMDISVSPDFYMDESVYTGSYKPQFESKTFVGNFSVIPVFSPDTSFDAIYDMIESANESIYIEQLYIYKNWADEINPFVESLTNKSKNGVDVKVILNYNLYYEETNEKINLTKRYFEEKGIETKFIYSNWSYFSNVHNKGMIVDNKSVLVSSINWNEASVRKNREAGIITENEEMARYYADAFFYDWNLSAPVPQEFEAKRSSTDYKNTFYIVVLFTMTFALIARDWRKRQWI